jgi:hypothetical protein
VTGFANCPEHFVASSRRRIVVQPEGQPSARAGVQAADFTSLVDRPPSG